MTEPLPLCRKCGGKPRAASRDIDRNTKAYAYHCARLCGNDTHWQMSISHAEQMWRDNPCQNEHGGGGSEQDDLAAKSH